MSFNYKFDVGDEVEFSENYMLHPKGARGVVYCRSETYQTGVDGLFYLSGFDGKYLTACYGCRLKKVEKDDNDKHMSWVHSLDKSQLRNLRKYIEGKLNTEEVVLYSCGGRKWGKKKYPETKLKMTYTLVKGVIKDQPVIESV